MSSNDVSLCFKNRVTWIQTVMTQIRLLHWAVWSAYFLFAIEAFNIQQQTTKQNSIVVCGREKKIILIFEITISILMCGGVLWYTVYCTCISPSVCDLWLNPLYSNGFFHLIWNNFIGMVHCIYPGVSGCSLKRKLYSFVWNSFFTVTNSVDSDEMPHHTLFHLGLHCL